MDFSAVHASFIEASYGLTGAVLFALCVVVVRRDRKLAKQIKMLKENIRP